MIQYLVDFENVHDFGLEGMNRIAPEDRVFIFHTSSTDRIPLCRLENVAGWVKVIRVPAGKQSLDMHLGSYLGYLIGCEENADTRYVIVSSDMDFSGVADFWKRSSLRSDKVVRSRTIVEGVRLLGKPITEDDLSGDLHDVSSGGTGIYRSDRDVVRDLILQYMNSNGIPGDDGKKCVLVSDLCSWLNASAAYFREKKRTKLKPLYYLENECYDLVMICKEDGQYRAYLRRGVHANRTADEISAEEDNILDHEDISGELEIPEAELVCSIVCEYDEENVPVPVAVSSGEEPDPYRPVREAIMEYCTGLVTGTPVRVSALRDWLMKRRDIAEVQKTSGEKPIPFLQHHFADLIRVYREKGIYWFESADDNRTNESIAV